MLLSLARLHIAGLHAWEWLHSLECVSWLEKYWHMVSCYPALPPSNAIGDQNNVRLHKHACHAHIWIWTVRTTGLSWADAEAPAWNQIHLCHQPSSLRSPEECASTWWQMSSRSKLSSKSVTRILLQFFCTFFFSKYIKSHVSWKFGGKILSSFSAHPSILTHAGSDFLAASLFVNIHTLLRLTLFYPGAWAEA